MAHIPVGTKLSITEYIPLPIPRPTILLEYTPHVPAQGLDLPEKFGVERMKEQINLVVEPVVNFLSYVNSYIDWNLAYDLSMLGLAIFLGLLFISRPFR